ncbi:MAG: hypothetical protein LIO79_11005 [Rikenellaceae bacterium]|nr:hypothetical protein [Rikenellaceae bacterium]
MKKDQINDVSCDPCNETFKQGVDSVVDKVDGYSHKDHREKRREVEDAFDNDKDSYKEDKKNDKLSDTVAAGTTATAGLAGAGAASTSEIQDRTGETSSANSCGMKNDYSDNKIQDRDVNAANKYTESDIKSNDSWKEDNSNDNTMCGCGSDNLEDSFRGSDDISGMNSSDDDSDSYDDSNDLIAVVEEINIYQFDTDDDKNKN